MINKEYIYLTEDIVWKEGMNKEKEYKSNSKDVTKYSKYAFLNEQLEWEKGLKVLWEKGEEAIKNELQQIHIMEWFESKQWHQLTKEKRYRALTYLMHLEETRYRRIKGRGCADGWSQQFYASKIKTSSPTTSLAAIMLTCMIDAFEKWDVATVDRTGACL